MGAPGTGRGETRRRQGGRRGCIMNRIDLSGRIALIGGGCGGIGQAVRQRFIESGATVIVWDLPETADDRVDVTSETAVAEGIQRFITKHGRLDILVNAAGITGPTVPIE